MEINGYLNEIGDLKRMLEMRDRRIMELEGLVEELR